MFLKKPANMNIVRRKKGVNNIQYAAIETNRKFYWKLMLISQQAISE